MSNSSFPDFRSLAQLRHDLRTPLNQIIGFSELLLEDTPEVHHGDLNKILFAGQTLLGLIDQNLTETRIQPEGASPAIAPHSHTFHPYPKAKPPSRPAQVAAVCGRILVVDDEPANGEIVARMLRRHGHRVELSFDGAHALARLRSESFDLVLLDLMMPGFGGDRVLREVKGDPKLRHLPIIMISALDEQERVIDCIESGAEDYLPKPFNPTLLHARISANLEKKNFRDQEQSYLNTIEQTQRRLKTELAEAENYIRSILPPPCSTPIDVDWRLIPSTELGGDSFGYHQIDEDHFAFYLLDVCGHGVGAALLSVAVANVLRSSALHGIEFRDPGAVLSALSEAFPMEKQNFMYFTIWYAVFHVPTRTLRYAAAGHPPALLVASDANGRNLVEPLDSEGPVVGAIPGVKYETRERRIPGKCRVYLVSDGTFEIKRPDGTMWPFPEFMSFFVEPVPPGESELDRLFAHVKALHGAGPLDDDFSILRVQF